MFNDNTLETFDLSPFGSSFGIFVPYTEARADGNWIFNALNGGDSASATASALGTGPGTGPVPGVGNLTVSGPLASPTLSWTLPADLASENDGNIGRLRTRVQDSFGTTVFDSRSDLGESLALHLTSYTIPAGFLDSPGTYYAQVLVEGFEPFIRSRTFSDGFTIAAVPEPSIILLFGLGLLGLAVVSRSMAR